MDHDCFEIQLSSHLNATKLIIFFTQLIVLLCVFVKFPRHQHIPADD